MIAFANLDIAFSRGATTSDAHEDKVIFPLLVSCRDIVEEVTFAIKEGFGRAALRATRTMYECVVTARYLNLHPEKADDFLDQFHTEWAKVYQEIPSAYRDPNFEAEIGSHVPKYAQGRHIGMGDLRWSGSVVGEMAREAGALAELHSLAFTLASAYIHPGAQFMLSGLSVDSDQIVHVGEKPQDAESAFALRSAHDLLMNAVDLRLKYAPALELSRLFDTCKADFERIWGYQAHI